MADSTSTGSSWSSSSSTPTYLETPENAIIDQLSGYAQQLAGQMNNWAQGVYAQTSQITDQAVGNFFNVSQQMTGLANGLTSQYNNLFAPENAQLVADANSYASPERMAVDMGMAGATQSQAGDQAIKNSEQNLLSYGIDPSAGRYAALDKAAAVQNAANVAGAENMQRVSDIATGQKLRSEAVQVGSQLPAAIANANNTAIQANTGASNATLANANTGVNLNSLADKYLQTAMGIKLPISGQNSNSSGGSQQQSKSSSPDHSGGGGSGGGGPGGGGSGSGGGGPAWMPNHSSTFGGGGGGRGGSVNPSAGIHNLGGGQPDAGTWNDALGGYANDFNQADFSQWENPQFGGQDAQTGYGDVGAQSNDSFDYGGSNPFSDPGFGDTYGGGDSNTFTGGDFSGSGSGTDQTGLGAYNYDQSANQPTGDMGGWGDYSQPSADTNWGDNSGGFNDYGGGGNSFGADYGDGFAAGGQVGDHPGVTVPPQASPSRGAVPDDVRANMKVGEFVIPEDVARWKGGEFFHNLIAKSRKMRAMSPVGGKPMPPGDPRMRGRPTFSTHGAQ